MERRDLLLLGTGIGAAALAAVLALRLSGGSLDVDHGIPEPPPPPVKGSGTAGRRHLPPLDLTREPAMPEEVAEVLRGTWWALAEGTDGEGAAALAALESPGKGGPVATAAPACLRVLAPGLMAIIEAPDDPLAGPAMAAAAGLARAGGAEGRAALRSTGFVERALALAAATGAPRLRVQAARMLGLVGGREAVEWLVILLRQAEDAEVRVAAVAGMAEAFLVERPAGPEPMMEVRKAMGDPATPAVVRRACLDTASRAWTWFQPYGIEGPAVEALRDPETLFAAACFFDDHPLTVAGPALVEALGRTTDPRILEHLAAALGEIRPEGAREALEPLLTALEDVPAREAVERALRRMAPK